MANVAIVGSGPAALMAADVVAATGRHQVRIFEKRKGPARKLYIAGGSGLNISNKLALADFAKHYQGGDASFWQSLLADFSPTDWIAFIEGMGLETFLGTSGRYFVKTMNAALLVRTWRRRLNDKSVSWCFDHNCDDFALIKTSSSQTTCQLHFVDKGMQSFDAVCFCLGGASYEPDEEPLCWPSMFQTKQLGFDPFLPSNVGYQVAWPDAFLQEAEGLPLKNVRVSSTRGSRLGDAIITRYGIEGTPIYFVGEVGLVKVDLKPDLSREQMLNKCQAATENLSPLRRVKKYLHLGPAASALLFHMTPKEILQDLPRLIDHIKAFPLRFQAPQPLSESISAVGGLHLTELTPETMMLASFPGFFAAGEMLNWDAPTGGFLIQACVSQGYRAGRGILQYLGTV